MTERQLLFSAWYLKSVALASLLLFALRVGRHLGPGDLLRLAADCLWQGSVWPLYLILVIFTNGGKP
ncbi:hypothetical protein LJC15_05495 [Desulfovibrio sp. OttesenSCG-928-G11]|nr:hypothetical protein [Desulfovibrio sp. OttesenSCG-928-G11]